VFDIVYLIPNTLCVIVQEKEVESEDDYVYDVYYRDDENLEHGINSANIGSLVWFEDQSEYMDDGSDSELGDFVDEDSNGKVAM
jgi:isopentenyldiphosphate isomerase